MTYHGINPEQIQRLMEVSTEPAISIYVPTSRTGLDALQGRVRLKNLLVEAEVRLVERGMRHTLAIDLLAKANEIDQNKEFWDDRLDSVAVFIGPEIFEVYHLPNKTPEILTIGRQFYVRPILPTLNQQREYYVLAIERNDVRAVRCNAAGAHEISIPDMPRSFDSFFALDHAEKQQQSHSSGGAGRAGTVIRHGAGDRGIDDKERLHRFCIAISRAMEAEQSIAQEPIVLIGTKETQDSFRSVTKLPHLLTEGIVRSPKLMSADECLDLTAKIVEQDQDRPRQKSISHYRELAGTGYTSQQIEEIAVAANQGKVDVLLTEPEQNIWGNFDAGLGHISIHTAAAVSDEEMINLAAIATIKNGGRVFDVTPEEIQLAGPVAAIYRY